MCSTHHGSALLTDFNSIQIQIHDVKSLSRRKKLLSTVLSSLWMFSSMWNVSICRTKSIDLARCKSF